MKERKEKRNLSKKLRNDKKALHSSLALVSSIILLLGSSRSWSDPFPQNERHSGYFTRVELKRFLYIHCYLSSLTAQQLISVFSVYNTNTKSFSSILLGLVVTKPFIVKNIFSKLSSYF
jgi:hypothetical protein